eukprot:887078-Rhodomonas_salina.1
MATRTVSVLPLFVLLAIAPAAMAWAFTPSLAPTASRFLPLAAQRPARSSVATSVSMGAQGLARRSRTGARARAQGAGCGACSCGGEEGGEED